MPIRINNHQPSNECTFPQLKQNEVQHKADNPLSNPAEVKHKANTTTKNLK